MGEGRKEGWNSISRNPSDFSKDNREDQCIDEWLNDIPDGSKNGLFVENNDFPFHHIVQEIFIAKKFSPINELPTLSGFNYSNFIHILVPRVI